MGNWRPVSHLRDQLFGRPPVVVFLSCLLILSLSFVCFGLYSQYHDIKNPDIHLDWNQVLGSIAGFGFCTHLNETDAHVVDDSPRMVEHADRTNVSTSTSHVFVLVPLVLMGDVPTDRVISATMMASQLGVRGAAAKTSVNISFHLLTNVNNQTPRPTGPPLTCLQLTALTHVLPQTPSPPDCPAEESIVRNALPITAIAMTTSRHDSPHCFSLKFSEDPGLTVLLSQEEKALCRYHLLVVSVTLLVICVLLSLCGTFSSSKPRSHQPNDLCLQKESLLS